MRNVESLSPDYDPATRGFWMRVIRQLDDDGMKS